MALETDGKPVAAGQEAARPTQHIWGIMIAGFMLGVGAIFLEILFPLMSPETLAVVYSAGIAVFLWGVYPSIRAASGTVSWITLAGPPAIAIFLFFPIAEGLRTTPHRSQRTIFASNTGSPGSEYFFKLGFGAGKTLRVFDVESLSDDEIVADVGELQSLLRRLKELCVPHLEVNERTREFVSRTLERVGIFGGHHDSAMDLVDEALRGRPSTDWEQCSVPLKEKAKCKGKLDCWTKCQDQQWEELISQAQTTLGDKMLSKRLDRLPFVIGTVSSGGQIEPQLLFAGDNYVGNETLRVTAIANPHRKSVRGLLEAIVVELHHQSTATLLYDDLKRKWAELTRWWIS